MKPRNRSVYDDPSPASRGALRAAAHATVLALAVRARPTRGTPSTKS